MACNRILQRENKTYPRTCADCGLLGPCKSPMFMTTMSVDRVTVYGIHQSNNEKYNGPVTAWCSSKDIAETAAHKSGWYGGDAPISTFSALLINGAYWILHEREPVDMNGWQRAKDEVLRKETLAGLSPEQIRVLGIKV